MSASTNTNVVQFPQPSRMRSALEQLIAIATAWRDETGPQPDAELHSLCEALEAERAKLDREDELHHGEPGWDPYATMDSRFTALAKRIGVMEAPQTVAGWRARQAALRTAMEWGPDMLEWLDPHEPSDPASDYIQWRL
jgi:hypothetical protein